MPGERALIAETKVLRWWRKDLGLPSYLSATEMRHGGWTETVDLMEIDLVDTVRRIRELAVSSDVAV
jgi:hypothetical protein